MTAENDFPLLIEEGDTDEAFPLLLAQEDISPDVTCEQAAERKRQVLQFGRGFKQELGRAALDANPGMFGSVH